ncbi:MAG: SMR family transporter [Bacteroidota bacterium]
MNPWILLFCASILEVFWIYSLKLLSVQKIREIDWAHAFTHTANLLPLVPLLGYIVFGVGQIILFSLAMKEIPSSTAFSIWVGMTLVWVKLVDTLVFKEDFSISHVVFMAFIIIGIIGLKKTI